MLSTHRRRARRCLVAIALFWLPLAAAAQPHDSPPAAPSPNLQHFDAGTVMPAELPFSEAVRLGDTVYLSGQVGVKPGTLELVEGGMAAEARQTLDNIRATLEAHGLSMRDVAKCTVMLADIGEWSTFNAIYQEYFSPPYPARSALGANGLALDARVEVECIAAMPGSPGG